MIWSAYYLLHTTCSPFWFFRYHAVTGDVLTSIKRTEDSLMRLKRSRKQPGSGASSQALNQENQSAMSDDDKIRLQFTLDTEEFGRAVRNFITVHKLFQHCRSFNTLQFELVLTMFNDVWLLTNCAQIEKFAKTT